MLSAKGFLMFVTAFLCLVFTAAALNIESLDPKDFEVDCPDAFDDLTSWTGMGYGAGCHDANFTGLPMKESAANLLFEIIQQATLPNETVYQNEQLIACLWREKEFLISPYEVTGGGVQASAGPVKVNLEVEKNDKGETVEGTLCAFPQDGPERGLTLGEIRVMAEKLSRTEKCQKCGKIETPMTHLNETGTNGTTITLDLEPAQLRFDWRENPSGCRPPCIQDTDLPKQEDQDNKDESASYIILPSLTLASLGSLAVVLFW